MIRELEDMVSQTNQFANQVRPCRFSVLRVRRRCCVCAPLSGYPHSYARTRRSVARQVNAALKTMQKENASDEFSNAEKRVRTSIHTTLAKRFYDLMLRYQQLKTENNQKYRDRVAYQVRGARC